MKDILLSHFIRYKAYAIKKAPIANKILCVHKKKVSSSILSRIFFPKVVPTSEAIIAKRNIQKLGQTLNLDVKRKPKNIILDIWPKL